MIKRIDLAGEWLLCLDEEMSIGRTQVNYDDVMELPGTTSCAMKGKPNEARDTGYLTDSYKFEGNAWFKKSVNLSEMPSGKIFLFLERTRITTVYVNGKDAGVQESFVAPHVYDVTDFLNVGENTIEICVANKGYKTPGGHMTSPDTQSNWNGITGEISLRMYGASYVLNAFAEGDIVEKAFKIKARVMGEPCGQAEIRVEKLGVSNGELVSLGEQGESLLVSFENGELCATYSVKDAELWSEFEPNAYRLFIKTGEDVYDTVVGLREFKASGDKFTINGVKTMLRGKHDGLIFPKTGYAPTDFKSWYEVLSIARSYGINHYRFHTCCPPDAAFSAADMLGVYMEPQLPFWGTITTEADENHNQVEQDFLISEGFKMMEAFGNHPSYCMMSMGNELWGSKERINDIIAGYKAVDKRHLYTQGSNNFQWFPNVLENDDFFVGVRLANDRLIRGSYAMCDAPLGHIQTDRPSTMHDYDDQVVPKRAAQETEVSEDGTIRIQFGTTMKTVKASDADADFIPEIPIITHEIGQFETYPDFSEIEKYTGPLKARNFEIFRERLEENGMLGLADKFFKASGKLAAACYKEELEAVMRSKRLAGFQLLDLQDFTGQGTALVGVLNAFMENKGSISSEDFRSFCNDIVVLAKFDSYTYESGDSLKASIEVVNFSNMRLENKAVKILVSADNKPVFEKKLEFTDNGENYIHVGEICVDIPELLKPCKAELSLEMVSSGSKKIKNSYKLWLYPKTGADCGLFSEKETEAARGHALQLLSGVSVYSGLNEAAEAELSAGKTVLVVQEELDESNSIEGFYCTDFWSYPMFRSISEMMKKPVPVGTMGLLIDETHPVFDSFPTEFYSTEQWWEIVQNSRSEILDDKCEGKKLIVQTIDNFERNHVLGLLYEYEHKNGKVVVLNAKPGKLVKTPEGRWFMRSLAEYCRR